MNSLSQLFRVALSVTLLALIVAGMRPQPVASANLRFAQPVVDVGVAASTFYNRVAPGGRLYWLATIANHGVLTANNTQISFVFPTGVNVNACIPEFGTCGGSGNTRTVAIPSIAPRQLRTALFTTTIDPAVAPGTPLSATVTLEPVANDENSNNNASTAVITVVQPTEALTGKSNGKISYYARKTQTDPGHIYAVDPDGSNETNLPAVESPPLWSPDGSKLAFYGQLPQPADGVVIFVSNPDGSGKISVATDPETSIERGFSWSPDGSMIVYSNKSTGAVSIARADGGGQARLPNSPQGTSSPEMSPNATRIVFVQAGEIWMVNLDGGGLRKLVARTMPGESFLYPHWSPDGSKILFTRRRTNTADAMLVNPDGTGLTRAFNVPHSQDAVWSPDGQKVLFTPRSQDAVWSIQYDGSDPVRLVSGGVSVGAMHWQPLIAGGFVKPLPDPPTFSISGEVTAEEPLIPTLEFRVSGSASGVAALEDSTSPTPNRFFLVRLPQGGQYTVTPESARYGFTPENRVYNNLSAHITDANFSAVVRSVTIRGRVVDEKDRGIPGLTVNIFPGFPTTTNAQGDFAFLNLPRGLDYSVRPAPQISNDRYSPESIQFPTLLDDATANFKRLRTFATIQGEVIDAVTGPVSGARVGYSIGGVPGGQVTTDAAGKYSFGEVPNNNNYRVFAEKAGFSFLPLERYFVLRSSATVNFYSGVSGASVVSAASFKTNEIAFDSIATMFGSGLAGSVNSPSTLPLPTEIDSVSLILNVDDFELPCPLFYLSPQQINFLIPNPGVPAEQIGGSAVITVKRNGRVIAVSEIQRIKESAPALFTANADGAGAPAAVVLRVKANGEQIYEPAANYNESAKRFLPVPIDFGPPAEQVFLILYGTGVRPLPGLNVGLRIDRELIPASFAGPLPDFPGLEQINIPLPRSFRGRGTQSVYLVQTGGRGDSNLVQIAFQ